MKRDFKALLEQGGNIFFVLKIAAVDGRPTQSVAASLRVNQRRVRCDDAQRRTKSGRLKVDLGTFLMARLTAGIGSSHVPAIGAALDGGRTAHPDWAPIFAGYEWSRKWVAEQRPDVVILVYNDHASAFSWTSCPPLRSAARIPSRRPMRAGGRGACRSCTGHSRLAWHIATSVVLDEFDLTIMNEMKVDHGLTVPMSLLLGSQPMAGQGDPAGGQCHPVSDTDGQSMLPPRRGHCAAPSRATRKISMCRCGAPAV